MIQDLIIIGAGGTSQEIAEVVEQLNQGRKQWNLLGYLDDAPAKLNQQYAGYPVLGPVNLLANFPSAKLVVGIANSTTPLIRCEIVKRTGLPADRFATIIHPSCHISRRSSVGRGSVVFQEVVISHGVTVGQHVIISQTTSVGHDDTLEDFVTVAPGAVISGLVRIGSGAFIGAGSAIMPGVSIGGGAVVGIGAVVLTDVDPQTTVLGNPARRMPSVR